MQKNNILLSLGSLPWMEVKHAINFARKTGYDGLEFLPTRKSASEKLTLFDFKFIKGLHQNWRLDIGQDGKYGINGFVSVVFILLRLIFFPKIGKSKKIISDLSSRLNLPVTVHGTSGEWTHDVNQKEFEGGVQYEILDFTKTPKELMQWLKNKKHFIEIDTRSDQSLLWAKKNGFNDWKELWIFIGLKKIKGIQLTLIGTDGIKKILHYKHSLAEEQLLWLFKNNWKGHVTVEINPLTLLFLFRGNVKKGLAVINQFVKQTLIGGKRWSL